MCQRSLHMGIEHRSVGVNMSVDEARHHHTARCVHPHVDDGPQLRLDRRNPSGADEHVGSPRLIANPVCHQTTADDNRHGRDAVHCSFRSHGDDYSCHRTAGTTQHLLG